MGWTQTTSAASRSTSLVPPLCWSPEIDELAGVTTTQAIAYLEMLFAAGPTALGSMMAGRAEQLIGDPAVTSAAATTLAADLVQAVRR